MHDDNHPDNFDLHLDPMASPARLQVGYSPAVRAAFESAVASADARPLRVARVDAQGCTLLGEAEPLRARIPNKLRKRSPPVVGDWVAVRERRGELGVRQRLDRRTALVRRAAGSSGRAQALATNLDRVLICTGLDRDFRLARLERWLSLVYESGAEPLVILTKAGLVDAEVRAARVAEARALGAGREAGLEVLALDVLAGIGTDALDRALATDHPWASSIALVGSSGVGKSTLLNHLSGRATMATNSVSQAHGKGRHTTSHRELVALPERGLVVVDTPGLREVGLWGGAEGIDETFAEITALAVSCRFADCKHTSEPGCAVAAAIEAGELDPRRLDSMRRLAAEQEATARRASEHARRQHERSFAKVVRTTMEAKRRKRGG